MFLFAALFAIVAIVYFALGTLSQRGICDTLRNPAESNIIDVADKLLNFKQFKINANISSILQKCHQNETAYNVFQLNDTFDLTDVRNFTEQYDIQDILDKLKDKLDIETNIVILNDDGFKEIENLKESGISEIRYNKFIEEVLHSLILNNHYK